MIEGMIRVLVSKKQTILISNLNNILFYLITVYI